ncbi:uncharacterized protein LOC142051361 isoform X2 [Phalacrocorax aristotelis]|uniref:uncharacterized protein LOC142051361 isoform X2 n=1 Tax=Phalacrocorax aristotelis TaxID=126867 RepID=UPI003F4C0C22
MGRGGTWKTRSRAGEVSMMWEAVREIMDAAGQALEPVAQVGRTRQNHRTILKVGPALKVTVPQPSGTDRVREQAPDAATDPGGTDREMSSKCLVMLKRCPPARVCLLVVKRGEEAEEELFRVT